MLLPKRVKYRRVQRGRMTGKATRGNVVCQGQYGLVALEPAWISSTQIEAARVAMTRYMALVGNDTAVAPALGPLALEHEVETVAGDAVAQGYYRNRIPSCFGAYSKDSNTFAWSRCNCAGQHLSR